MRISQLTTDLADNPILDLDWPRGDFRIACLEMLIGLLATACPPEDDETWKDWWHHPPSPDSLDEKFAPLAHAFVLDGDSPRFCQDFEDFSGEPVPIERLLIDAPGENTVKRNTDLLVKRDRIALLGRSAAAMALYTLQAFAPSGGAGHRTSLRGGGPLTTLVRPPAQEPPRHTLWHLLWANVPCGQPPRPEDLPKVFPWLAPTRCSEGDAGTVLDGSDAHPLQAFWGMPRRIRLDFRAAQPGELCGITGQSNTTVATGFRTRPWGVQYVNAARFHPLTPTYRPKSGEPPLAMHLQPDGIGYRNWHRLVSPNSADKYDPATAVVTFQNRKPMGGASKAWAEATLLIGGYDMDNMKARSFIEAEMPLFFSETDKLRRNFLHFARSLAEGATLAAGMLRGAIRDALHIEDSDQATVDDARQRFFELTTADFWTVLRVTIANEAFRSDDEPEREKARLSAAGQWHRTLREETLSMFDSAAPLDPLAPNAAGVLQGGKWKPPPIVAARRNLAFGLNGYGKAGKTLFDTLGLKQPETKSPKATPEKTRKAARNG